MEYFAENRKLTKILNDPRLLVKNFGRDRAKRIQARLDEFDAVDVSKNFRIVFEGYDKADQLSIEKSAIVTVQIIKIEDYH